GRPRPARSALSLADWTVRLPLRSGTGVKRRRARTTVCRRSSQPSLSAPSAALRRFSLSSRRRGRQGDSAADQPAWPLADALAWTFTETLTLAFTLATASRAPLKGAPTQAVRRPIVIGSPAPWMPAWTPLMTTSMLSATSVACFAMPIDTVRMPGRFFSMAAWNAAEAFASAAPVIRSATCGGVHSAFALSFASHFALHSALIFGGSTWLAHFGAFISTGPVPPHLPLHSAFALPLHLPSQVPPHCAPLPAGVALPSHLPWQLPEPLPLISASHEPVHSPEQAAEPLISQSPWHEPEHSPCNLPGSHLMSALPGVTVASQCPEQSA